jgi:hypothetical protein
MGLVIMPLDFTIEQAITLSEVTSYVSYQRGKKVRYTTVEEVGRFLTAKPTLGCVCADDVSSAIEAALAKAGVKPVAAMRAPGAEGDVEMQEPPNKELS